VPLRAGNGHLSLANLKGRTSFGPYLKLRSYDPETRRHTVTVLVVLSPAARSGAPALSVSGGDASAGAAKCLDTQHGFEFWRFAVTTTAGDDDAVVTYQVGATGSSCCTSSVQTLHAVLCGAVLCGAVLCGAVLCGAVRCGAVLCGAVLYHGSSTPSLRGHAISSAYGTRAELYR